VKTFYQNNLLKLDIFDHMWNK